jgi:hypothetical protein
LESKEKRKAQKTRAKHHQPLKKTAIQRDKAPRKRLSLTVEKEKFASWPVSRVLYGSGFETGTWQPFIWGGACAQPRATHPDDWPENRPERLRDPRRPYSVLLPVGFALPPMLPCARWALTPPFHPDLSQGQAVFFLWHFP